MIGTSYLLPVKMSAVCLCLKTKIAIFATAGRTNAKCSVAGQHLSLVSASKC